MKPRFSPGVRRSLLAASLLVVVEAQAANGITVTTNDEDAIAIGMSTSEVHNLLGRPERVNRYWNAPGPVWTYRVVAPLFGKTEFNVEFSADQRVIAKSEYVVGNDAPNRGHD